MAKRDQLFAVYLREGFIGLQPAPSADMARIRYAHRSQLATGNTMKDIHAHLASPDEIKRACRYCRRKKENPAEALCNRCKKRSEPDDRRNQRRDLIAQLMRARTLAKP